MKRLERIAWMTLVTVIALVLVGGQFVRPGQAAPVAPFAAVANGGMGNGTADGLLDGPRDGHFTAGPSRNAFGASREVRFRFSMPDAEIEFPLDVSGDPTALTNEWVSGADTNLASAWPRPASAATSVAPPRAG